MSRENPSEPRASLEAWYASHLRLTTFHLPGTTSPNEGLWRALTGADPESSVGKPRTGERAEVGQQDETAISLNVNSKDSRVDWVFADLPAHVFEPPETPTPTLAGRMRMYRALMRRWIMEMAPPTTRLAVGAVMTLPVTSREEGYVTLSRYLTFDLDPVTSSDFLFQINRFRESNSIAELRINRLTKWSVSARMIGSMRMTITPPEDPAVNWASERPPARACQIEADLNTVPREDPLPQDRLPQLFDELVEMLGELLREGDV